MALLNRALAVATVVACASCSLALDTGSLQGGAIADAGADSPTDSAADVAPADDAGPTCTGSGSGDACLECLEQHCCAALRACYRDPECSRGFGDFAKCEHEAPKPSCAEKLPAGLLSRGVLTCAATACTLACTVGAPG